MNKQTKKVFVGISGGVDSSVSAALLKEQGYDVTGIFIKVWQPPFLECSIKDDRRDAMRVCAQLGIPFVECDAEEAYKTQVIDYMMREYTLGRTPNPDVMCNKYVKFGVFYDWAMTQGADYVATGHYARTADGKLMKGIDAAKDQSYFLWAIGPEKLKKTLFPIGNIEKSKVRFLAEKYKLFTATKKDSQGLCFLGKLDVKDFLKKFITPKIGDVLDVQGNKIGEHDGAFFFTLGERHGFRITEKRSTEDAPLYVISKDVLANTITVATRNNVEVSKASQETRVQLTDVVMYNIEKINDKACIKTAVYRYHGEEIPVKSVESVNDELVIILDGYRNDIAAGQSMLVYVNDEVVAAGIVNVI
jgi:tRNA-specific 2-thiouridylase